ncbi:MAG: tetratricopeptide repeat protein, partial [Armatimonadetes bacterium]|nr:tetratricopeptide repeat protein [Armatimonadota bacterium]
AESSTALAIGELLSAECCEVSNGVMGEKHGEPVGLDQLVRAVAQEQVGDQGNRFLNVTFDVRSAADSSAPEGDDRRELLLPEPVGIEHVGVPSPVGLEHAALSETDAAPSEEPFEALRTAAMEMEHEAAERGRSLPSEPVETAFPPSSEPVEATLPAASEPVSATLSAASEPVSATLSDSSESGQMAVSAPSVQGNGIMAIVAEQVREHPKSEAKRGRAEYVRKSDWLRAQFLPEVEALDFSGLFVGNLGLGIRQERTRRQMVLSDPSRVTDILLRANGYRRSGEHAKALICYQELVDMDPGNADFRFLLGKTLMELGQRDDALHALSRARELGHEGADKELERLSQSGNGNRRPLSFLRFWKQ